MSQRDGWVPGATAAGIILIIDPKNMVEQVTGRLNYGGAALKGATSGAVPGALIGWIFGLFNLINPLVASAVLATPITG